MMGSPSRFTHKTRLGRGSISRDLRDMIWQRDEYTCQFCGQKPGSNDLTIDHLIPLSLGGLDESTNMSPAAEVVTNLREAFLWQNSPGRST